MANRPYFMIGDAKNNFYIEKDINFQFYTGFALTQKQKSIQSLHNEIKKLKPQANLLEVSRRSENPLGISLSAFNLLYYDPETNREYPVENVFQSSKVFVKGGPYRELLNCSPRDAKTDERIRNSGNIIKFNLAGIDWDIEPKTLFYDYIYISSLYRNKYLTEQLQDFDTFTDIEFNPQRSINCQARSVAIFVTLVKHNLIEKYLNDKDLFKSIYKQTKSKPLEYEQTKLF